MRLSFSKLSRYERCPLAYRLHYIDKLRAERGPPLRFGSAIHEVLETLVIEHLHEERVGPLSKARADALWHTAWAKAELSGLALFQEGLDILHRFVGEQVALDHQDVLAVEQPFRFRVGEGFEVMGYIDRVDRVDDETIEVIDYKTSRQLFSRDEVDNSLQLALYQIAAQDLWPWAKKVRLSYWMLRHGLRQQTQRSAEALGEVRTYIETLGRQIREAKVFAPRLNTHCVYCDHRQHCSAYVQAVKGQQQFVCEDTSDLAAVAKEREEVTHLAKILYNRKHELEKYLRTALRDQDEIIVGGMRYTMYKTTKKTYPIDRTLSVLEKASGLTKEVLLERIAVIDNRAVSHLLKELPASVTPSRARLLEVELDALAEKTYSTRFWAKEMPQ